MGGGPETIKIPHWQAKQCTVGDHTPELQELQRRLAVRGLKDPWARNEAWRYARIPGGYAPSWNAYSLIKPRALVVAFAVGIITSQIKIRYFDKKWEEKNHHLYPHMHH